MKSESEVAQLCPTLSGPMDCSPLGSSIHGIFQTRVLEWGAIAFSQGKASPSQFQIPKCSGKDCNWPRLGQLIIPRPIILAGGEE